MNFQLIKRNVKSDLHFIAGVTVSDSNFLPEIKREIYELFHLFRRPLKWTVKYYVGTNFSTEGNYKSNK